MKSAALQPIAPLAKSKPHQGATFARRWRASAMGESLPEADLPLFHRNI